MLRDTEHQTQPIAHEAWLSHEGLGARQLEQLRRTFNHQQQNDEDAAVLRYESGPSQVRHRLDVLIDRTRARFTAA
jgi:hypothetical protein